jgi:hypothetical protein
LIHFSDCLGVIGPVVCAKLASDFAAHEEAARKFSEERIVPDCYVGDVEKSRTTFKELFKTSGKQWFEQFQEFRKAFQLGAQGGMVMFH